MTTTRATVGTILTAVSTSATVATNALISVDDGMSMLSSRIRDAKLRQEKARGMNMAKYERQYALDTAEEVQRHQDRLDKWLDETPNRRSNFQTTLNELLEAAKAYQ